MDRRLFLGAGLSAGMAAALPAATPAKPDDALLPLLDRILDQGLAASPQNATLFGLDDGARAGLKRRLDDRGPDNRLNIYRPLRDAAPALAALPAEADPRRSQWLATARWYADRAGDMARFPLLTVSNFGYPIPYAVNQLSGAYAEVPDLLATQHVIATAADCEAYLARLDALARAIDQDTAMSRAQAAAGTVPPDFICDRALTQLGGLARQRGGDADLVKALVTRARAAGIAGDWTGRATALVDGPIAAALGRQIAHMTDLRRRAGPAAGIGARPGGDAFYAMALAFQTTTVMTPKEVHRVGLEQVAAIQAEADALMRTLGYTDGTVIQRMQALSRQPDQLFANTDAGRAALLAFVRERTEDIKRRLPRAFSRMPKLPMDIRRVPPATELGAPSAYSLPGSMDGTRPGTIYFNLADTADWPKWQLPTTVYHEGYPGHHFQGAIAVEAGGVPTLFQLLSPAAYGEGWALYAEELADELGTYDQMPLGRLGRLQGSLFRACRLVVDTGMHDGGWSRERAIAYLVDQGGQPENAARREIERYVVWPGQACSYKIGHLEFLRLRAAARARQGDRFSLKAFHDAVMLGGGMPLSVMAGLVERTLTA